LIISFLNNFTHKYITINKAVKRNISSAFCFFDVQNEIFTKILLDLGRDKNAIILNIQLI